MPIRQTIVDGLYLLCDINVAPHTYQTGSLIPARETQTRKRPSASSPYEQDPARKRLKSRNSFLHSVEPLDGSALTRRLTLWSSHLQTTTHKLSFSLQETLPPGSSEAWSSLNHLRTGTGRCKAPIQKWGYNEDGKAACDEMIMRHLVVCLILPQSCSHEDLEEFNPALI